MALAEPPAGGISAETVTYLPGDCFRRRLKRKTNPANPDSARAEGSGPRFPAVPQGLTAIVFGVAVKAVAV